MDYAIYRISLTGDPRTPPRVLKILRDSTDYAAQCEIRKFNKLCIKNNFEFAYVYREQSPQLEIPVFQDTMVL